MDAEAACLIPSSLCVGILLERGIVRSHCGNHHSKHPLTHTTNAVRESV